MPKLTKNKAVVVEVGPLIDDTDFKTLETAIAYNESGMSVDLIKHSGTAITKVDITPTSGGSNDWTHKGNGVYELELTATQNDTIGTLRVVGVCDGVLPFESPVYSIEAEDATIWYVDGTNGNDGNDGHQWFNAKATIQAAVNAAASGDKIIIAPGMYSENIDLSGKDNIHLWARHWGAVTINPTTGKALKSGDNCTIENLSLCPQGTTTVDWGIDLDVSDGVKILGCRVIGKYAGMDCGGSNVFVKECYIKGTRDAVSIHDMSNFVFDHCLLESDGSYSGTTICNTISIIQNCTGIFTGCTVRMNRNITASQDTGGVKIGTNSRIVFDHCTIDVIGGAGVTSGVYGVQTTFATARVILVGSTICSSAANASSLYDLYNGAGQIVVSTCSYSTKHGTILQMGSTSAFEKAAKMLVNKAVQNKITGAIDYYDDDGQTVILTHTPTDEESTIMRASS
jgi:hypothetical protein